ncbi:MAG TPA: SpoIIE family protein phosphatase [Candidatus Saccharimonadales bacterium]|nr:SpoIIE family protein phosphatase [Candidatus Saccharimonadales bacterium]
MADPAPNALQCVTFRYPLPCDLGQIRAARVAMRRFLEDQRVQEEEIMACELSMAEACNNAVQNATGAGLLEPIEVLAICTASKVEIHVHDHTEGFDWPEEMALPDAEDERGRGIFFIQSFMDGASYFRGHGENSLVMRKMRYGQAQKQRSTAPPAVSTKEPEEERPSFQSRQAVQDMARELCFRSESLAAIFRCSADLGRTEDLKGFARRLLGDLLHITDGDWFVLRLVSETSRDELPVFAASEPAEGLEPLCLEGGASITAEHDATISRKTVFFGRSRPLDPQDPLNIFGTDSCGVAMPIGSGQTLLGTVAVGRCGSTEPFSAAQMEVVRLFADFLNIQIVNARFREEHVASKVLAHELELARNIQRSLLPKTLPNLEGYGLAGHCETASQVGGDFYDVLKISESKYLLFVTDVMGKGVPAAMFASILQRLVRIIPEWISHPGEMLGRINSMLYQELSSVEMFITAQLALVDTREKLITVAVAGQGPVLVACQQSTEPERMLPEGLPLGVLEKVNFQSQTRSLGKNGRVLLYTDGITEARNVKGEFFGLERLQKWFSQTASRRGTAAQLKGELLDELKTFGVETPLRDDQTFLILAQEETPKEAL